LTGYPVDLCRRPADRPEPVGRVDSPSTAPRDAPPIDEAPPAWPTGFTHSRASRPQARQLVVRHVLDRVQTGGVKP
jgi:hypothetical protein